MQHCALADYGKAHEIDPTPAAQAALQKAEQSTQKSTNNMESEQQWLMNAQREEVKNQMAGKGCCVC